MVAYLSAADPKTDLNGELTFGDNAFNRQGAISFWYGLARDKHDTASVLKVLS